MAKCSKCGKPSSLGHRCDPYDRRRYSGTSNSLNSNDTYVFPDVAVTPSYPSPSDDSFQGGGGDFGGGGSSGSWDSGSSDSGSSSSSD